MIARLQRFYGGDPGRWLHTPMMVLSVLMDQLPRLQAEEALTGASIAAVGSGAMKQNAMTQQLSEWKRAARQRRRIVRISEEEKGLRMAQLGIQT